MKPALILPAVLTVLVLGACADSSPGGQAVRARHEHFGELGGAVKTIDGQLKDQTPTSASAQASAAKIAELAPQVKDWFPAGSGPQDGKRTHAKAEIWTRQADFGAAATRLEAAAIARKAAVAGGDGSAVRPAFNTLGAACKNCHQTFTRD